MRRASHPALLACVACLAAGAAGAAGEAWTLQSHDGRNGKTCSLSTTDRGRALSISASLIAAPTDQGVVGISFEDPNVVQAGTKTLATLEFDDGSRESHRLEARPGGSLLIPIVTSNVEDVLRTLSESRRLRIATRFGSTSFSLDGIADHIPALRQCAGS